MQVREAIKEMRDKKATGDEDVPGDVLRLLGEDGFKLVAQLITYMYKSGEWPKEFTEVTMIALKRKPEATEYSDHCMISLIAHIAKIVARILRRIEMKTEYVLGEDQF
jgi:hypothetical protein